jgi:hypothetical protein
MKIFDNKKNGGWILATIIAGLILFFGGWYLEEAQDSISKIPVANMYAVFKWIGLGVAALGFLWLGLAGSSENS